MTWSRFDTGADLGYERGEARIFDNGDGFGRARGSGRWALELGGLWIANLDTLAEAKGRADELTKACASCTRRGRTPYRCESCGAMCCEHLCTLKGPDPKRPGRMSCKCGKCHREARPKFRSLR